MRRLAAVLALLAAGPRDGLAQGAGPEAPSVPEAAAPCLSCHGAFGRPDNLELPIIGGQNAPYLAAALRAYRAGQRSGVLAETMTSVAQPLDDRTIDEVAAFFSSLRALR